jgi:hypothetical protein
MSAELGKFVPLELVNERVSVNESMVPIIGRISQYLASEKVWEYFSSMPETTGGVRRFPYFRVDNRLFCCDSYLSVIKHCVELVTDEEVEDYRKASEIAMKIALWVEVGFEGLQNLAIHPASKNWTSGVGHFVNDEQRAKGIMTNGKEYYESVMREFVGFRDARQITDDCFTTYNLEGILEKWRGKK